jgi:hypothetical protein
MYPDPLAFRPESFLLNKNDEVARDPAITGAFGYGTHFEKLTSEI